MSVAPEEGPRTSADRGKTANLHRRHLTTSQKAMVAADALPLYEVEAKKRQLATLKQNASVPVDLPERIDTGDARDQAAAAVGVSGASVSRAKKIIEEDPDLADEVRQGKRTVNGLPTGTQNETGSASVANSIRGA